MLDTEPVRASADMVIANPVFTPEVYQAKRKAGESDTLNVDTKHLWCLPRVAEKSPSGLNTEKREEGSRGEDTMGSWEVPIDCVETAYDLPTAGFRVVGQRAGQHRAQGMA